MAQLVLISSSETTPPATAPDGSCYGVPSGAVNAWAGQEGAVAVASNGGWVFVPARRGWRAMVLDAGQVAIYDGQGWRPGAATLSPSGAAMGLRAVELTVNLSAGASVSTDIAFPARAVAFGVTGRVTSAITGTAIAWSLGVAGDAALYGSGLGLQENSWVNGPGNPVVMWSPTPLLVSATGGDFAGGTVSLVAHFAKLWLPDAV